MTPLTTTVGGLTLAYSGFVALSLAMDRHYADVFGRGQEPGQRQRLVLRLLGVMGLLLSFALCVVRDGWGVGSVLWLGMLTACALTLVLLLPYAPRRALELAVVSAIVGSATVALDGIHGMLAVSA